MWLPKNGKQNLGVLGGGAQWGESRFIAKLLQILSIESHDLTSF